jgi:hypothetical protein
MKMRGRYVLIPFSKIEAAITNDEMAGFCLGCGEQSEDNCEPDARKYPCTACHENLVYGAQEIVIMNMVDTSEETKPEG